jgi:hypothetical protein
MAREHKTDYRQKHGSEMKSNPVIEARITEKARHNALPCAIAFEISSELNVPVREVGIALDFMNVRLTKCQLGLFGHEPGGKLAKAAKDVDRELAEAIASQLLNGRLPCARAWEIAARINRAKQDVSHACEALKIKIKPCQLGAF